MELPSEHGGIPWGIAASLLHVHRVLLTVVALPCTTSHASPGGLSALQSGDGVIEGAAHGARRCEDEAGGERGLSGVFQRPLPSRCWTAAACQTARSQQHGTSYTQKCRDYTAPGARQFNA